MLTITCKCGSTTKTFQKLKKSDFPDGWVTDCCKSVKKAPKPQIEKAPEPKKEVVAESVEVPQPVEIETDSTPKKSKKEQKRAKKRGESRS